MSSGSAVAALFFLAFVVSLVAIYFFCCRKKKDRGYRQVTEGEELDEEELAFQRSLEEQHEEFGAEDLEFDDKELDQLRMLDSYRGDLVGEDERGDRADGEDSVGKKSANVSTGGGDEAREDRSITIEMTEPESESSIRGRTNSPRAPKNKKSISSAREEGSPTTTAADAAADDKQKV